MDFMIDYAARHWRGEFPLGKAFWLNGVLGWFVFSFTFVQFADSIHYLVYMFTKFAIAIFLWAGIWRSTYNHQNKKEAFIAKSAVCLFAAYLLGSTFKTLGIL